MERRTFKRLFEIISLDGWLQALKVADEVIRQLGIPYQQLAGPYFERSQRINPLDPSVFRDAGYHPYRGFFARENRPGTFSQGFEIIKEFTQPEAKFTLYKNYKQTQSEPHYLAALLMVYKLLKNAQVPYVLNGISVGIIPGLKSHGLAKVDSYGTYAFIGGFEHIAVSDAIYQDVITDFEETTRFKILEKIKENAFFSDDVQNEARLQVLMRAVTILHELGHRVEFKNFLNQHRTIFEMWQRHKTTAGISKYGVRNYREWFAECFVAWVVDRLSYNQNVKTDFEIILFGGPEIDQRQFQHSVDSFSHRVESQVLEALEDAQISPGEQFSLGVSYTRGPNQVIEGIFREFIGGEIPTLKYLDSRGLEKAFNWFPGRDVKKIVIKSGWEED